jgi:hypothetical protein
MTCGRDSNVGATNPTQVFGRLRCEDRRGANEERFSKSLPQFKGRLIHSFQNTRCLHPDRAHNK